MTALALFSAFLQMTAPAHAAEARFAYRTSIPGRLEIADDKGATIKSWPSDDASDLHWSPDGRWLMITANGAGHGTEEGPWKEILLITADGSKFIPLPDGGDLDEPSWFPSGDAIIAQDWPNVVSISSDGAHFSVLCSSVGAVVNPFSVTVSPDGKRWLMRGRPTGQNMGNMDFYLSGPNCSNPVQLTDEKKDIYDFGWAPDGKRIAFINDGVLVVLDVDGKRRQEIKEAARYFALDWTDDGRILASWDGGKNADQTLPNPNTIGIVDPAGGKTVVLLQHPDPPASILSWRPRPKVKKKAAAK